ncbi:MAG: hypothetical protein JST92_14435 [Deltaproteobacteria bacterium]|nr:hypothetical protein [Deltaproteobacteria bacterium]
MSTSVDASAFVANPGAFLAEAMQATSAKALKTVLAQLQIVSEKEYVFDADAPEKTWQEGKLHWYPVGRDRGNAGRIKLAGNPENPIAERTINAMEAVIERERQLELAANPNAPAPLSPRDAVLRYFDLPPLDQVPGWQGLIKGKKPMLYLRELASKIRVRLLREKQPVAYTLMIEDEGIGQPPEKMHSRLLSLGQSDKGDKPYLIGVFGQGGSSAYASCDYSWIASRRSPELLGGDSAGVGWTVIRQIIPGGRRDPYWAYLAAHPDGRVPAFSQAVADGLEISHGTKIAHIGLKVGKAEPSRTLYQALNHLLFNPVLPYELYTRADLKSDRMSGNAYRLSNLDEEKALDKTFAPQTIEKKSEEKS